MYHYNILISQHSRFLLFLGGNCAKKKKKKTRTKKDFHLHNPLGKFALKTFFREMKKSIYQRTALILI